MKSWCFRVINWNALIDQSSIYNDFANRGMEFSLTRTDRKENSDLYTSRIFHEFRDLNPDAEIGALCPVYLGKYFDSQIS